jgi:hypothetical protein
LLSGTDQTTWTTLNGGYGISDDGVVVGAGRRSGSSFDDGFAIKPKP